jgi:hypothetical protein
MQFWQSNSLHLLAERIREEHSAAEVAKGAAVVAARKGIEHALVAGDLLIEAKAQIPHGHWLPWLAENCPTVSERMAQHYMRLARNRVELEAEKRNVSDLSLREAVRLLDEDDDEDADEDTDWDDEPDPLSDQQKDQILALRQNYGWEPDAIAKTLKLPLDDVRRFLQPTDDDDDDDDEPRRKRRRKRQQLGGSGDNEYLTPPKYIEAARDVLGTIDLDPASCHEGQVNVRAAQYFTKEEDGLQQQWHGRVFLNPTWSDMLPWVAQTHARIPIRPGERGHHANDLEHISEVVSNGRACLYSNMLHRSQHCLRSQDQGTDDECLYRSNFVLFRA